MSVVTAPADDGSHLQDVRSDVVYDGGMGKRCTVLPRAQGTPCHLRIIKLPVTLNNASDYQTNSLLLDYIDGLTD